MDKRIDGQIDGFNKQTDEQTNRRSDGCMYRWIHGHIHSYFLWFATYGYCHPCFKFQALSCQLEDVVAEFEDVNEHEDDIKEDDSMQRSEQVVAAEKDDCYSR